MMARSAVVHDDMMLDFASSISSVTGCTRENPEMRYVAMREMRGFFNPLERKSGNPLFFKQKCRR